MGVTTVAKRQSIGKGLRFDIFHRDGFTCQYCGKRPPDVVLELDHIHPVANGGDNDPLNLITSCAECNRGKSAKLLGSVAPRPDADLKFLEVQQEVAEARRYLAAKDQREKAYAQVITALDGVWLSALTPEISPTDRQWRVWLTTYAPREIEDAIYKASPKYQAGQFGRWDETAFKKLLPYVSGIMKRVREESDGNY
jgi:hypothetical protein